MWAILNQHIGQQGGGNCSLCGSQGVNKSTCPLNSAAKSPNPGKHPLAQVAKATKKVAGQTAKASSEFLDLVVRESTPEELQSELASLLVKQLHPLYMKVEQHLPSLNLDKHAFQDLLKSIEKELSQVTITPTKLISLINEGNKMEEYFKTTLPALIEYNKLVKNSVRSDLMDLDNELGLRNIFYPYLGRYPSKYKLQESIEFIKEFAPEINAHLSEVKKFTDKHEMRILSQLLPSNIRYYYNDLKDMGLLTRQNFSEYGDLLVNLLNKQDNFKELKKMLDDPEDYFSASEETKTKALLVKNQEKYLQLQYDNLCKDLSNKSKVKVIGMAKALKIATKDKTKEELCAEVGARLLLNQQLGLPIIM